MLYQIALMEVHWNDNERLFTFFYNPAVSHLRHPNATRRQEKCHQRGGIYLRCPSAVLGHGSDIPGHTSNSGGGEQIAEEEVDFARHWK